MATNTYVALATQTLGTAVASVTFSSISQAYTDLQLVITGAGSTGTTFPWMRFNGLSTNIYSDTQLSGTGSSAISARRTAQSRGFIAEQVEMGTTQISNTIVNIMNYSNSTTYKTYLARNNNAGTGSYLGTEAIVGLAQLTAAITSITIGTASGSTDYNYAAGSTFTLYGIAAEGTNPAAKATGGTIYSDSLYYYHAFAASGTFTPTQSLTADVLIVSGGGGGSQNFGGGGGAGGVTPLSSQSLSATGYNVTIGGGGAAGTSGTTVSATGTVSTFNGTSPTGGTGSKGGGGGQLPIGGASGNGFAAGASGDYTSNTRLAGGSGGGAGAVGSAASSTSPGARGGNGATSALINAMGTAVGIGQNVSGTYYIGGGGGGGGESILNGNGGWGNGFYFGPCDGGFGGGGNAGNGDLGRIHGVAGRVNTGSGGGGGAWDNATGGTLGLGGAGGSGVVIVRYAKA